MKVRGSVIAALLVLEVAITGEAVVAVKGSPARSFAPPIGGLALRDSRLAEDGPHDIFEVTGHPSLTVDIGYADLTIVTGAVSQIDVSARASKAYGIFRATAPITARKDGQTVRIATLDEHRWTMGDDRMVTVVVPPETEVTVVEAGDINADGLHAAASFKSIGRGSITVEDYAAPALVAAAMNGRISLHRVVADRLDAKSENGRVDGSALQVRDGDVESDGRVTLGFAPGADTLVTAATSDGTVRVSGFGASASAKVDSVQRDDSNGDSSSQTLRVGAGDGRLDVHSDDGNIDLVRET